MHIISLLFNWFKLVNSTLTFFCFCFLFVCFVLGHSLKCPQDVILIASSNLLLSHWSEFTFILSALLFGRGKLFHYCGFYPLLWQESQLFPDLTPLYSFNHTCLRFSLQHLKTIRSLFSLFFSFYKPRKSHKQTVLHVLLLHLSLIQPFMLLIDFEVSSVFICIDKHYSCLAIL